MGKSKTQGKFIPPDGGWGWMVALGYALNNLVMVPLITGLSLIFKDLFNELNFAERDGSIILSVNMAFGMLMGMTHGPLLRTFGYRKIALTGSTMFVSGLLMTGMAKKFPHFLISHGFLTSYGISLTMASFSLAINTYFHEKRGRAMGLAMSITGLGPILMPQFITFLSENYTKQHAIFILGAISMHTIVASLLLQPIKWHSKRVHQSSDKEGEETNNLSEQILKPDSVITEKFERSRTISLLSLNGSADDSDLQTMEVVEKTKKTQTITVRRNSVTSLPGRQSSALHQSKSAHNIQDVRRQENRTGNESHKWLSTGKNLDIGIFDSYPNLYQILPETSAKEDGKIDENSRKIETEILTNGASKNSPEIIENGGQQQVEKIGKNNEKPKGCCSCFSKIVDFFDLTLLCDPIYVNLMLGMAIAAFAEVSFAVLLPFILKDFHFDTHQCATVMTTIATVDLLMRGVAPYVGERLRQTPRIMYLISSLLLIGCRSILMLADTFSAMIAMAIGIGFCKGFRSVFMALVVPSYVPIERLADATGIQMVVNGLVLMVLGPFLGIIRQSQGNYSLCIVMLNSMTTLTILMWTVEMTLTRLHKNRRKMDEQEYEAVPVAV